MKIDNAIMSVDDNPLYQSYWPYASEVWDHFGIYPILIHSTKNPAPFPFPSKFGEIITVSSFIESDSEICRHPASAVIPGVNYMTDIDHFICNKKIINLIESKLTPTTICTYQDWGLRKLFVGASIVAQNSLTDKIYRANNIFLSRDKFWTYDIAYAMKGILLNKFDNPWGIDEEIFSQLAKNAQKAKVNFDIQYIPETHHIHVSTASKYGGKGKFFVHSPNFRWKADVIMKYYPTVEEIDDHQWHWNFDAIRNGFIWQIHIQVDKDKKITSRIRDTILETKI